MDIIGKVISILPIQEGVSKTGNPWKLKSFILETQDNYPRKVCIEIFGEDRINNNPFNLDDVITVSFDLESREFNGRWYTSVRAYRIQQGAVTVAPAAIPAAQPVAAQPAAAPAPGAAQPFAPQADESSDLPF